MIRSGWLVAAGALDTVAALLHFACIVGGPPWYRAMGAGVRYVRLAERGSWEPPLVAAFVGCIVAGWAAYAFSGAGLLPRLPLLRPALIAITVVYLLRALSLPLLLAYLPGRTPTFLWWSSAVVLVLGIAHLIGLRQAWADL